MAVPWKQLLVFAPQIIEVSRELLKRARGTPKGVALVQVPDAADVPQRIAALEENERRQAELVERMAQQQDALSRAVVVLHRRQRILAGAIVVLAAALAWQLFFLS
ncbi:MAG: hypothetical protein ABW278_06845 [Steroidobacteraceae bacterium]